MQYTITVNADNEQALKFMEFVQMLAGTYSFLQIEEKVPLFSAEQEAEIDFRYEEALQNPTEGKTWDEIEKNLDEQ